MNRRSNARVLIPSITILGIACGGSDVEPGGFTDPTSSSGASGTTSSSGGFGGGMDGTLQVEPSNAVIFIDTATMPATRGTQTFKVTRKKGDGSSDDVSASATFVLERPTLGTFAGPTFTSVDSLPPNPPAVTSKVVVSADGVSNSANITVVPLRRSSDNRDFFFVEPYQDAPSPMNDVLKFKTNIQAVDVAFVMDTTGSMGGAINALKTQLSSTLTALQTAIPSVQMAIVSHRDETDGAAELVKILQKMTPTLATAQTGVNLLTPGGGGDLPEGQVPAMYHVLTGASVLGGGVPAVTPAPGTRGAVNFRIGAVPVMVLITDAAWHAPRAGVTTAMLNTSFTGVAAKFVALTSTGINEAQPDALSDATASNLPTTAFVGCAAGQCCTGVGGSTRAPSGPGGRCRLNFKYNASSPNIGKGVVDAIKAISVGSTYDVTARPSNDPMNAGGVDATKFIKALRAKDEGDPAQGCPAHSAKDTNGDGIKDTFETVTVGTPVCFEVIPQINTTVPPAEAAQFFGAFIDVLGVPGDINLDKRKVTFLVPPKGVITQ
jgi:hypothetical protein